MADIVYTLKENSDTNEYHLFRGTPKKEGGCSSDKKSICGKMDWVEGSFFACEREDDARVKCAYKGRKVCGVCVSDLYATQ